MSVFLPFKTWFLRRAFRHYDRKKYKGYTIPEDVERFVDLDYGSDEKHLLDVYRPKGVEGKLPVILSIHGGGWQYGDKELYSWYCMDLARRGFVVINHSYHICPEDKFPTFFLDNIKAFRFAKEHAEEYGMDLDHFYAVGDSAGGHMLAQYCVYATNKDYQELLGIDEEAPLLPKAVGLNCGMFVIGKSEQSFMRIVFPKDVEKERVLKIVDLFPYINEEFPPAFLISCPGDFLLDNQPKLKQVLDNNGIENEFHIYGDKQHPLIHVFHMTVKEEHAIQANDEETAFLKKH